MEMIESLKEKLKTFHLPLDINFILMPFFKPYNPEVLKYCTNSQ